MKHLIYGFACFFILPLAACSIVTPVIGYKQVKHDLRDEDRQDLKEGNLLSVRDKYEERGIPDLGNKELAVLCDIYVKHMSISNGLDCLDALQNRMVDGEVSERIAGKRALIAYLLGRYERSAELTLGARGDGSRYVHALAQTRLGDSRVALKTAQRWARAYDPEHVFLAANLFLANGRYNDALKALLDPEPGLARYYSLTGARNVFGQQVDTAPLKIDLFDEFGFGLLDTYSYAPAANVYVEFIIAKCELELGNRDEARKRFDRILSYPNIGAYREVLWRALSERANIAEKDGNPTKAADFYKQAIDIIESVRSSINTEAGRIGFVGNKQSVYAKLIRLLLVEENSRTAFEYTERARSRALVDLLANQRQFGGRAGLRVDIDDLLRNYQRAESLLLESQGIGTPGDVAYRSSNLQAKKKVIRSRHFLASHIMVASDVDSKQIQSQLLTNETLLSYYRDSNNWNVIVVPKTGPIINVRLHLPDLAQEIQAFRAALENGPTSGYRAIAQRLYDRLIKPIEGNIAKSGTLTIVPFGELHYLPFAALDSGRGFLVEEHILRIIPSARLITILKPTERPRGRLLAFGNPNRTDVPSLPYAEREAQRVVEIYKPSKLLLRREASLAKFETLGPDYDILHFAVHGEFDRRNALRSRLLLASSNGDTGDLEATDLYAMEPALRASIVVLSACETGLAEIVGGDELIGLQRGFLCAGADSIIGTLWRIADETTVYLMEQFYTFLDGGASRADALRQAQLKTMKRFPNRGDWAAFIYTGDVS